MNDAGVKVLAVVVGFWLVMRSIRKDATNRTLIDHLTGGSGSTSALLPTSSGGSAVGAAISGAAGAPGMGSVLKSLFPAGTGVTLKRKDQGRDLQAPAGTKVLAPGNGYLVRNASDAAGFGISYPIVHFTSGPWAGEDIYIGHTRSLLSAGARFLTGQPIAQTQNGHGPYVGNAAGSPGWAEIGLAPGGNPGPFGQPVPAGL